MRSIYRVCRSIIVGTLTFAVILVAAFITHAQEQAELAEREAETWRDAIRCSAYPEGRSSMGDIRLPTYDIIVCRRYEGGKMVEQWQWKDYREYAT